MSNTTSHGPPWPSSAQPTAHYRRGVIFSFRLSAPPGSPHLLAPLRCYSPAPPACSPPANANRAGPASASSRPPSPPPAGGVPAAAPRHLCTHHHRRHAERRAAGNQASQPPVLA
ncbi:unnamed protein product [Urochloa humidicola]